MFCLPHRYKVCISGAISLGYSVVSILFTCLGCVNEDRFFFNLRPGDSDWIASNALDCLLREVLRQDEGVIGLLRCFVSGVISQTVQQVRSPLRFRILPKVVWENK
ncbi:hypothetical protein B296_00053511 [Ensete ventricosum]|uniref:Uncharacterized protein n=1 Tax=Ensete ventricosum TaxID=4639 RepID=A0A426Y2B3_ENSVE|nr:hypothetical protein B296_00053511 [Ensete ventricosum]